MRPKQVLLGVGTKMFSLKGYRSRARSLADLLPYAFLVQKDVIVQKDGGLLAAWLVKGIDADSATANDLERVSVMVNSALMQLDSGYAVFVNTIRMPVNAYHEKDAKHWPDPVSAMIDDERRQAFSQGKHFASKIYLAVSCTPPARKEKLFAFAKAEQSSERQLFDKALKTFTARCQELEDSLGSVLKLTRLSAAQEEEGKAGPYFSSLLSFIELCITGKDHPRMLMSPVYLDACLGLEDFTGGLAPKIGTQHIAVIALDGLPSNSFPAMLSALDTLAIAYRFSTRFLCLDKQEALHEVQQYSKTWGQRVFGIMSEIFNTTPKANRDAVSMHEDAENAYANVQGDKYRCGFYTANIVLLHEDKEELYEASRIVRREVQNMGFGCRFEDINAVEAWLSTQVGNVTANVRRPLLTTHNLADMLPLSTIWAGRGENPCPLYPKHSPPLTYCATNGSTPFRLNLHVDDVGHTLIFGPTGAGKSTLLGLLAAQFRGYAKAKVFTFDKGYSMYPLTKAVGGMHLDIAGDEQNLFAFCPLSAVDEKSEQAWAEEYIAMLCELQGLAIGADERIAIHAAMLLLAQNDVGMRSLTDFCNNVMDREIKKALQHYTQSGAMGYLLDADTDSLTLQTFMTFEIEHLMNLGDKNLIPVLLYIFHRIEKELKGQPTLLILDEAWIMLGHPVFRAKIREWLKVLRKANCAVLLSTQSLSDAANSGIMDVLIESCHTKILLANSEARTDSQLPLYRSIGLNSIQIDLVAEATPKREYYVMSSEGSRKVHLGLGPITLAFVGASDKDSRSRIKELEAQHGTLWPAKWLEEKAA